MKPNYYLIAISLLLCLTSCLSGFRISGTVPTDNPITFDHYYIGEVLKTAGTAKPKKGKFSYKDRTIGKPEIYFLSVNLAKEQPIAHFFIAEKGHAQVSIDTSGTVRVWGTELNNRLQSYYNQRDSLSSPFKQLYFAHQEMKAKEKVLSDIEKLQLRKDSTTLDSLEKKIRELDLHFTRDNINNAAGRLTLNNFVLYSPSVDELKEIIDAASKEVMQLDYFQNIVKQVEEIEKSAAGKPFIDVELNLPDGKNVFIADYVNKEKSVLIYTYLPSYFTSKDAEELRTLYTQNKNLKILAVALDSKKKEWLDLLKQYDMQWIQLIDISGWMGDFATAYNINSFPYYILLSKDGTILLRSTKLDDIKKWNAL